LQGSYIKRFSPPPLPLPLPAISFKGLTYKQVVSPYTKKVWLDRNLGAEKVAADGGYYKLEPAKKIGTCPFGFDGRGRGRGGGENLLISILSRLDLPTSSASIARASFLGTSLITR
jgi:hypothetical protein